MEIQLLVIGKNASALLQQATDIYLKRLSHYISYTIRVLPDIKNSKNLRTEQQKEAEGQSILSALQPSDYVVLLDERGREYTSMEFASYLSTRMSSGLKRLIFVVGGPYGFSEAVYARGDAKISLSKMTFSHEMIRLFFTEQVYRAMTILRGEPYHHE